jgi:hypothetical protein
MPTILFIYRARGTCKKFMKGSGMDLVIGLDIAKEESQVQTFLKKKHPNWRWLSLTTKSCYGSSLDRLIIFKILPFFVT